MATRRPAPQHARACCPCTPWPRGAEADARTEHGLRHHERDGVGVGPRGTLERHGQRALGGVGEAVVHVRPRELGRLLRSASEPASRHTFFLRRGATAATRVGVSDPWWRVALGQAQGELTLASSACTEVEGSSSGTPPKASEASLTSSWWSTAPAAASTCARARRGQREGGSTCGVAQGRSLLSLPELGEASAHLPALPLAARVPPRPHGQQESSTLPAPI